MGIGGNSTMTIIHFILIPVILFIFSIVYYQYLKHLNDRKKTLILNSEYLSQLFLNWDSSVDAFKGFNSDIDIENVVFSDEAFHIKAEQLNNLDKILNEMGFN